MSAAAAFRFRLQRVLGLRHLAERGAAMALGVARVGSARAHAVEESLRERRARAREMMFSRSATGSTVAHARQVAFVVEQLDTHTAMAAEVARAADGKVEETRARLNQRLQERRILERLRERHFADWLREVDRLDREEMDSIARNPPAIGTTPSFSSDD